MPSNNYIYKMSNAGGLSTVTRYADMLAGNAVFVDGDYESIATVSIGAGGASTATFSSIPQTYQHLQIRWLARGTDAGQNTVFGTMNGLTASSYAHHLLYGGASEGVGAEMGTGSGAFFVGSISNSSRATNCFSAGIADIFDYTSTSKVKVMRSFSGRDDNTNGIVISSSTAYYASTPAITSLVFNTTGNFTQYTHFGLYGIKG
jgi:hypothetical protein